MQFIYNLVLTLANWCLPMVSSFNAKLKKGTIGRSSTFDVLKNNMQPNDKTIWFHCASLGEYEQGLPVFEAIRKHYKSHKTVLSFFSPSGYEIRKNSPIADVVVYLPLDTKRNAKQFIKLLKPELSVFVKYDIWPNYLRELQQLNSRKILISAAFRPHQAYFKWYGGLFKNALTSFDYIFTQDEASKTLLNKINYTTVRVSGDTRFDRVSNQLKTDNTIEFIEHFKADKLLVVIGSSWEADEKLYIDFINTTKGEVKFLIAPHEIDANKINRLTKQLTSSYMLFSNMNEAALKDTNVFILNTIGLLSKAYTYANIAYVGGAAGHTGLHNILEPATFGVPILFGTNHSKFKEAQRLIDFGGAFEIGSKTDLNSVLTKLISNKKERLLIGHNSQQFIETQTGATKKVLDYLTKTV